MNSSSKERINLRALVLAIIQSHSENAGNGVSFQAINQAVKEEYQGSDQAVPDFTAIHDEVDWWVSREGMVVRKDNLFVLADLDAVTVQLGLESWNLAQFNLD